MACGPPASVPQSPTPHPNPPSVSVLRLLSPSDVGRRLRGTAQAQTEEDIARGVTFVAETGVAVEMMGEDEAQLSNGRVVSGLLAKVLGAGYGCRTVELLLE